ncbi:MAG: Iodotyrosine dehalogenase [Bacteroidota bacterium]
MFIKHTLLPITEQLQRERVADFYHHMNERRSVRQFDARPVPKSIIEMIIKSAATAPSGAHKQPWHFCAVSNAALKAKIRMAAEAEEIENYNGRMNDEWLQDLKAFGTDENKPFLTIAPWLIIVFKQTYGLENDQRSQHYYVNESVGIACGLLLAAIHHAGLAALTHTPSPMNFLAQILNRPANEKPFLLIPVGYPASNCMVPDLQRKSIDQMATFFE